MMNASTKKPSIREVIDSVLWTFGYPSKDQYGQESYWLSQDFNHQESMAYMEAAEQFVECILKAKELPYFIERTIQGKSVKKINNLGDLFYQVLRFQNKSIVTEKIFRPNSWFPYSFTVRYAHDSFNRYEVSEYLKVLYYFASELNLNAINFTFNPATIISDGLLEAELINSLIHRISEALKRDSFKVKNAVRKKESSQGFIKTKRYIERLYKYYPHLYSLRLILYYKNEVRLSVSQDALMMFLNSLNRDLSGYPVVGWWWKQEYMTELNNFYYLILFFEKPVSDHAFVNDCIEQWHRITSNQGFCFIALRSLLSSKLSLHLDACLYDIRLLLMRDYFLKLPCQQLERFGIGERINNEKK